MESLIHFIEAYFIEERIESIFIITLGLIATLLACVFLFIIKYSFFKGMAIPLLVIGIIQLAVGTTIYNRSQEDIERVNNFMKQESQKINKEELPRMEKVMKNFTIYKWIEISLIICSILLFIKFNSSPQTFWKGLALGLLIQASAMLCLDIVAEQRGQTYIENLHAINKH